MDNLAKLKNYFEQEPEVLLAFVFGSAATGRQTEESDFDLAVYLKNKESEHRIHSEVSRIVQREVDCIFLDEVPASLVSNIFKTGIPLTIKDKKLYWDIYLSKTAEAEDFAKFVEEYWKVYQKAQSLIPEEKTRLIERIQFLEKEISELDSFKQLTFDDYENDSAKRRNIERWVENILNASIDIAKIILASEKFKIPKTYEDALYYFGNFVRLSEEEAKKFSKFSDLRNILAHEYLDILYQKLQSFIVEAPSFYEKIFNFLNKYLDKTNQSN